MSDSAKQKQIIQAVNILQAGGLVAFPTETVYGLGADASNPTAVRKIFAAKGRPADHPVIVHLAAPEQLNTWARDIPAIAWQLAARFWPGALTLILKRAEHVCDQITGGQDTIGLRVPSHPIAQALLQAFGGGIAAPSANKFGRISPTQAAHVQQELGDQVDLILDGGASHFGIESTIIDVSGATARLLRPGAIPLSELNNIIHGTAALTPAKEMTRTSGMLLSHYAPVTPLKIVPKTTLSTLIKTLLSADNKIGVLAHSVMPTEKHEHLTWYTMPAEPISYAHELYSTLRAADAQKSTIILVEAVPEQEAWLAVKDRLKKAEGTV